MSTGALENICQQKSGRAIALPAPPPLRSLVGSLREAGEKRGRVLYMVGPKRKEVNFSVEINCVQLGALFSKDLVITGPGKLVYVWYVYIQDPQLP